MDMASPASKRTFNVSKDSAEAMQCLCLYLTRTTPERRDVLLLTLNTFITKFTSMETQNQSADPTGMYLFKDITGNTRSMFEGNMFNVNKDTRYRSVIFIVNFGQILHMGPVFSLLALNKQTTAGKCAQYKNISLKSF